MAEQYGLHQEIGENRFAVPGGMTRTFLNAEIITDIMINAGLTISLLGKLENVVCLV